MFPMNIIIDRLKRLIRLSLWLSRIIFFGSASRAEEFGLVRKLAEPERGEKNLADNPMDMAHLEAEPLEIKPDKPITIRLG